jgi:hypothetical protein
MLTRECTIGLICLMALASGCARHSPLPDVEEYKKEIADWQAKRAERLTNETGWFTLIGLFWLKEGENTFGSDSSNAVVFPKGKAPAFAGSFWLDHGAVRCVVKPKSGVRLKDSVVTSVPMVSDADGLADPTTLTLGPLSFFVIKRGDQYAIRARDKENPSRKHFKGLTFFPIDPKWRVDARFEPYTPPRMIEIATVINTVELDSCPGALVFEIEGETYRLDAVMERGTDDAFFVMFGDATNGKETYGLGRQMYAPFPKDGKTVLDFNRSYNWPCVYTSFATCPIAPRQNRLPVRIEAGEKMYVGH